MSGGNVLVEIDTHGKTKQSLAITLNSRDVAEAFRPGATPGTLVGLVSGLVLGKNTLQVVARRGGKPRESLELNQ